MIRIAVIGFGYWGPNIVRNLLATPSVSLSWICDMNPKMLADIPRVYPTIKITTKTQDVFDDAQTDAVVIATPPSTHFQLAKTAIGNGKHVLVEKPFTTSSKDAQMLVTLAKKKKRTLMVDHTFLYTPAVRLLKKIITAKTLGTIISVDSVRTNLGLFQKDSNVIADLAVHDFSIMDYLFTATPKHITATGRKDRSLGQETVAYISVEYPGNLFFHTHVSWLSPIKIRRMTFVGTKKMLVYDDIEPSEKIKIYDKSVTVTRAKHLRDLRVGYRTGAISIPNIPTQEGLFSMVKEFVQTIRTGKSPISDGAQGLRVVRCIEETNKSLRKI